MKSLNFIGMFTLLFYLNSSLAQPPIAWSEIPENREYIDSVQNPMQELLNNLDGEVSFLERLSKARSIGNSKREFGNNLKQILNGTNDAEVVRRAVLFALGDIILKNPNLIADKSLQIKYLEIINGEIESQAKLVNPYLAGTVGAVLGIFTGLVVGNKILSPGNSQNTIVIALAGLTVAGSYGGMKLALSLNTDSAFSSEIVEINSQGLEFLDSDLLNLLDAEPLP